MKQKILGSPAHQWTRNDNLADGGKTYMDSTGTHGGFGIIRVGDNEEYGYFGFSSSGVITLITNSANITTTEDNAGKFNIFNAAGFVGFNNELGSIKNILVVAWFS